MPRLDEREIAVDEEWPHAKRRVPAPRRFLQIGHDPGELDDVGAETVHHALPRDFSYSVQLGSRSEEHTSELQSLMRISYAVFCLKKKKHYTHQFKTHQQ